MAIEAWRGRLKPWLASTRRVRRPVRFAFSAAVRRSGVGEHRLRDGGTVVLRYGSRDVAMFREVFGQHVYDPPPAAVAALSGLGRPVRILDLGGNVGVTAVRFRQLFADAVLTSYEPDPDNLDVLRETVAINAAPNWRLVEACAGVSSGSVHFIAGEQANSHLAADGEVGGIDVPVVDAMPDLIAADLVKIDIEGGEWALLTDPRFGELTARAVVMEHHGRHAPTATPRQTATDILERLGFTVLQLSGSTPTLGALWAWR